MKRCIITGGNQGTSPRAALPFSTVRKRPSPGASGMGLDFAKHLAGLGWYVPVKSMHAALLCGTESHKWSDWRF